MEPLLDLFISYLRAERNLSGRTVDAYAANLTAYFKDLRTGGPGRAYTKAYVELPTNRLRFMTEHPDPGGAGRTVGIDVYETPKFYDWFVGGVQVVP